jgi:ubiquinone/menaquinone biosynthesis C-methylase UbiE
MTIRNHEVTAREAYAIWASFYDTEHNPLIMTEAPRVQRLLETLPTPERALDAATGTGRWALHLARQGVKVTGIDASPEMLAVARAKADAEGLPVHFMEGDLTQPLPFADGSFDLVVCALALSTFDDLHGPIADCARVLRPGGHLLVTDFHPQAIRNGWEPTCFVGQDGYILPHPDHDRGDYLNAIADSACDLIHLEEVLVREEPPGAILAPDLETFLAEYGDWPFCLIALGRRNG